MSSDPNLRSSPQTPLDDPAYLQSPLTTLADSLKLESHVDAASLLDAYDTFIHRVKSQTPDLQERSREILAANQIRLQSSNVIQALRRDIGRAHYDPIRDLTACGSSASRLLSEGFLKAAKEASLICQRALCFWHVVIHFRAIYEQFSASDILSVLDDVIGIYLCQALPALNGRKIQSLAICSIQFQQLPPELLASKQCDIVEATKCALSSGDFTKFADGVKVLCYLLDHYSTTFRSSIVHLLCFMHELSSGSFETRSQATMAVAKVAQCLSNTRTSNAGTDDVATFILSFATSLQATTRTLERTLCLFDIINNAISASKENFPGCGPAWAVSVLASLIVLSGSKIFSHRTALKLVFHSLKSVETHEQTTVRAFHAPLWKCLVWAFIDLVHKSQTDLEVLESAFGTVNQVHRAGVGTSLVISLLDVSSLHGTWSATKAFGVLRDMITSELKHVQRDAVRLLKSMTGPGGSSSSDTPHRGSRGPVQSIANALLDGSLVQVEWETLPKLVKALPRTSLEHLRGLSVEERNRQFDSLLLMWSLYVESTDDSYLHPDVIGTWKNLLMIEPELIQEDNRSTVRAETAARAGLALVKFLPSASKPSKNLPLDGQIRSLKIISHLWQALCDVYVASAAVAAAKPLLANILIEKFQLEDEEVLSLWSRLCEELARTVEGSSPTATVLAGDSSSGPTQRLLWSVAVNYVASPQNHLALWDIVALLGLPFRGNWTMLELELDIWRRCLKHTIHLSHISGVGATRVIDHLIHECTDLHNATNNTLVLAIILQIPEVQVNMRMLYALLSLVNDVLCATYPPQPQSLRPCLDILTWIRQNIVPLPVTSIPPVLVRLQKAIKYWFEDEQQSLSRDEYNHVIVTFYCEILGRLELHPLSTKLLEDIGPFLAAGFVRIPEPALAPTAFEHFWRATYRGKPEFEHQLPEEVQGCLAALNDAFGSDISQDVHSDSPLTWPSPASSQQGTPLPLMRMIEDAPTSSVLLDSCSLSTSACIELLAPSSVCETSHYSEVSMSMSRPPLRDISSPNKGLANKRKQDPIQEERHSGKRRARSSDKVTSPQLQSRAQAFPQSSVKQTFVCVEAPNTQKTTSRERRLTSRPTTPTPSHHERRTSTRNDNPEVVSNGPRASSEDYDSWEAVCVSPVITDDELSGEASRSNSPSSSVIVEFLLK